MKCTLRYLFVLGAGAVLLAKAPAQGKDEPVDLPKVLSALRERFAQSRQPTLEQTRIDRVQLSKNEKDPDQPQTLHISGISLRTAIEDEKQIREVLSKELAKAPIQGKFVLNLDQIKVHDTPLHALQKAAVATGNVNADFNVLFERATFAADGTLQLHVLNLGVDPMADARLKKLLEDNPVAADFVQAPGGNAKAPVLTRRDVNWKETLRDMQRWLARNNDTLLRKTRVDRGYFTYTQGKAGPQLNLELVGVYPAQEALEARLNRRLDAYAQLYLSEQVRGLPLRVATKIENAADAAALLQAKVHEIAVLDGVRLDDASFDGEGVLTMHGIWVGKVQQTVLEKYLHKLLAPTHELLKRGVNWTALQEFDAPDVLRSMRLFVAEQQDIDELWLERFYFDASGKERITGFFTRESDKVKIIKRLPDLIPYLVSRKLPAIEGLAEPPVGKENDGPIVLTELKNIAQQLRENIAKDRKCDGLRIDRCYYDADGAFRIDGLSDHAGQTQELKDYFDSKTVLFDLRQLAKGWKAGRQTVIPLGAMLGSLAENMPSVAEFDGLVLDRAHHDASNRLVLSGNLIGASDAKQQAGILQRLLGTHSRWRQRVAAGFVLNITDKKDTDAELAKDLTWRALRLLQVNIGEAKVDPGWPVASGWWSHAWPYDERLKRERPSDEDYVKARALLDTALRHDPKNVLAWYLRGFVLQTQGRTDLTLRDFRRMVALELDDDELRERRILNLELVQGRLRQSAYRIEQTAILQVSDNWTLRTLPESPPPGAPKR